MSWCTTRTGLGVHRRVGANRRPACDTLTASPVECADAARLATSTTNLAKEKTNMGTRSNIGILEPNGSVTYIYCHWDGYVEHHGPILRDHYTAEEKVRALIALGSISSLGEELGEKHDFDGPHDGVCNVYGRDRGESNTDAVNDTKEAFYSDQWLAYLFDPTTSSWTYYDRGKASPLTDTVNGEVSTSDSKLKFGALERGEHFICWPVPGDNSGHGGYLRAHRLFVKTGKLTAVNGGGIESSMNTEMDVIKILLR